MTQYKYNYRKVYKEMLQEEIGGGGAPAGAMGTGTGVTGDSGSGVSSDQGSYGPSDARIALPLSKKNMKRILNLPACKTASEGVNEACENCQCETCESERGTDLVEACKKRIKEFFGESFDIEEYQDESMSSEELNECYMLTVAKKPGDTQQTQTQTQPDNQAPASSVCQTCNTDPCKCQKEPVQGQGDPNLNGQPVRPVQ